MLRTKCILLPPTRSDGLRISVMSRHTLNDGSTPDSRLSPVWSYDFHLKDISPPDPLVGKYYRGEISFSCYIEEYLTHLQKPKNMAILNAIAHFALKKRVTFLCIEYVPTLCHRTTLLWECLKYEPDLRIQNF